MKELLDDMITTIKRLNKELEERTTFEAKLIKCIDEKDKTIQKLKEELNEIKREVTLQDNKTVDKILTKVALSQQNAVIKQDES